MLRLWLRGEGLRSIARLAGVDRKTARRYVEAAGECGPDRVGGEGLDPFCGTGTTSVAALSHGRRFTGIDLNPHFAAIAAGRLRQAGNGSGTEDGTGGNGTGNDGGTQ